LESMDDDLRNGLWTALSSTFWDHYNEADRTGAFRSQRANKIVSLLKSIWIFFFKEPSDAQPEDPQTIERIRSWFYKVEWFEVYDLIEYLLKHGGEFFEEPFREACNHFLQEENSGYRIVGKEVTAITSATEIAEIEEAASTGLRSVNEHISAALRLLSDRKTPDHRNSIKESISAVESACRLLSGAKNETLAGALKILKTKVSLHPAMEKAFLSLYGYTSDQGGIRHSLLGQPTVTFTDAKFMLVSCSAFVNYLIASAAEAGINIKD